MNIKEWKITNMRNVNFGGNSIVRASFDLLTPEGLRIRDCFLKEGSHGWFWSGPSKKLKEPYTNKDGKTYEYMDIIWIPEEPREIVSKLAEEMYDPEGVYPDYSSNQSQTQTPNQTTQSQTPPPGFEGM